MREFLAVLIGVGIIMTYLILRKKMKPREKGYKKKVIKKKGDEKC